MARLYESPTIERVGGDDLVQPMVLAVAFYVAVVLFFAKYAAGANVAAVANVAAAVNMFAGYNWAWFWNKKKKK